MSQSRSPSGPLETMSNGAYHGSEDHLDESHEGPQTGSVTFEIAMLPMVVNGAEEGHSEHHEASELVALHVLVRSCARRYVVT